jgi:hypothetical protein
VDWTEAGIWLVGIGSAVSVVTAVVGAPRAEDGGLVLTGPLSGNRGRVRFAAGTTGLLHVAFGSVILMIVEFPAWWFAALIVATVAGSLLGLTAWKQRQYRISRRDGRHAAKYSEGTEAWRRTCLEVARPGAGVCGIHSRISLGRPTAGSWRERRRVRREGAWAAIAFEARAARQLRASRHSSRAVLSGLQRRSHGATLTRSD